MELKEFSTFAVTAITTDKVDFHELVDIFITHFLYAQIDENDGTYRVWTTDLEYNPMNDEFDGGMDFYNLLEEIVDACVAKCIINVEEAKIDESNKDNVIINVELIGNFERGGIE